MPGHSLIHGIAYQFSIKQIFYASQIQPTWVRGDVSDITDPHFTRCVNKKFPDMAWFVLRDLPNHDASASHCRSFVQFVTCPSAELCLLNR